MDGATDQGAVRAPGADARVRELLERIDREPTGGDVARLALRYADLGLDGEALATLDRLPPGGELRHRVALRLARALPPEIGPRALEGLIPSRDRALGDAFAFATSGPGLTLVGMATIAIGPPLAALAVWLGPAVVLPLWLGALAAATAFAFRTAARTARSGADRPGFRATLADLERAGPTSLRRMGPVFAVLYGPPLLAGLVLPVAGGAGAIIASLWFAAAVPALVRVPGIGRLDPRQAGEVRRRSPEDFQLLLAVGALFSCILLAGVLLFLMGAVTGLLGTASVLTGAVALVRLGRTAAERRRVEVCDTAPGP